MTFEKPKRIVDEELLAHFRKRPCDICHKFPSDPAHLQTRGSGGNDVENNLVSLCREHHTQQGQVGFFKMFELYPFFRQVVYSKGWTIDSNKKLRRE